MILAAGTPLAAATDLTDTAKWRADYVASLRSPSGWLSVAGLFWLHEGANAIGSDPRSDVVLPRGGPERAGVLRLEGGKGRYQNRQLKSDVTEHPDVIKFGDVSLTVIERGGKTGVRLRDPNA